MGFHYFVTNLDRTYAFEGLVLFTLETNLVILFLISLLLCVGLRFLHKLLPHCSRCHRDKDTRMGCASRESFGRRSVCLPVAASVPAHPCRRIRAGASVSAHPCQHVCVADTKPFFRLVRFLYRLFMAVMWLLWVAGITALSTLNFLPPVVIYFVLTGYNVVVFFAYFSMRGSDAPSRPDQPQESSAPYSIQASSWENNQADELPTSPTSGLPRPRFDTCGSDQQDAMDAALLGLRYSIQEPLVVARWPWLDRWVFSHVRRVWRKRRSRPQTLAFVSIFALSALVVFTTSGLCIALHPNDVSTTFTRSFIPPVCKDDSVCFVPVRR
eukprot:gene3919-4288_t